jgi:hypothetical protein
MCLLHRENKSLHQLISIATNELCEFFSCVYTLETKLLFYTMLIVGTNTH